MEKLQKGIVYAPAVLAVTAVVALAVWLKWGAGPDRVAALVPRTPGDEAAVAPDGAPPIGPGAERAAAGAPQLAAVEFPPGTLARGDGKPSALPGAWPSFRGPQYDGIARPGVKLARSWPAGGPKVLWSVTLGDGHAGPAVLAGRVYVLDHEHKPGADVLRCLSLDDGREIWSYRYPVVVRRQHGMSRTVPAVSERFVVALGPKCHALCCDAASGEKFWGIDLVERYGAAVPLWYTGQCPLIHRGRAILAPCGPKALMIAVDCATGKVLWTTPNPRGWKMTHSSIVPMSFRGREMFVYCGSGGVVGVSADDGRIVWDSTDWRISVPIPSPVILPDDRIFLCGGYNSGNSGAILLRLEEQGGRLAARTLYRLTPPEFGSTQQTPILWHSAIYGIREHDKQLVAIGFDGRELWRSGVEHAFGLGPYLIAEGLMYVLDDDATLTLAEAAPGGYRPLAEARVIADGADAWAPMALVGSRLLLRDATRLVCLDVGEP